LTRLAAIKAGFETFPVVVQRGLSEDDKRALRIADNQVALLAGWDQDLMQLELGELKLHGFDLPLLGFGDAELASFIDRNPGLTDPDEVPAVPEAPVSKPGDVWLLGPHRLFCGDATSADDVAKVLNGNDIDLLVTSPPYNQKIDGFKPSGMHKEGNWVSKVGRLAYEDNRPERDYQKWQGDLLILWFDHMRDGSSIFYNHKNRYRDKRVVAPTEWLPGPFVYRQEIIWRRPGSVTQNARMFLPCDERIYWLYKGDDFTFNDETEIKTWSTVWDIPPKANLTHAVAFPVELPMRCIRAASMPGDAVYDPFVGSGTTIIAAEMTGRKCCAIEISPAYVDVALLRWQAFTGEQATLDGQTFEQVKAERLPRHEHQPEEAAVPA
jgi:DNA modification methylase